MFTYLLNFMRGSRLNYALKPEELICVQFTSYMKEMTLTGKCKHVWFHVANEGSGGGKQFWGKRQRNMGKFAGVSDYVFLGNSSLALEIKADAKKTLEDSQEIFKRWCGDCDVPYVMATSYQEAVDAVIKYKVVAL